MEEILLYGRFQMLPSCTTFYDVNLTRQNIMFVEVTSNGRQRKLISILMSNVIGCKMYRSKLTRDVCSYFKVITLKKDKKNVRQKHSFTFRVNSSENRDENYEIAENWSCMITWLIYDPTLSVDDLRAKECFPPQRKYYVVINPKSGPGKSLQWFNNTIEPLFREANIKYEVFITEYSGHLTDMVMTFDYSQWDAFVICSGDGLVFEFINGLMRRPDWKEILKLPIGILPTGSGNALAASILYSAKEKFSVVNALYVLLKGRSHPMDLFSVISEEEIYYGFLTVSWGIMSDIDIESEKFRAIGPFRFTVGAINRILNLRHYTGVFSYLPGISLRKIDEPVFEMNKQECSSTSSLSYLTQGIDCNEGTNDDLLHQEENYSNCSEAHSLTLDDLTEKTEVCSTSSRLPKEHTQINNPTNSETVSSLSQQRSGVMKANKTIHGPECSLPDLDTPLPDEWVTVEGEFVNIVLSSLSHIGSDMFCSPGTYIDDGVLNLQYIKQGPNTSRMLKLFTSFESGKHIDFPEVEIHNVKAFRLIPVASTQGNIAVDGELIDYKPIQGEIHPSLANVIMIPIS